MTYKIFTFIFGFFFICCCCRSASGDDQQTPVWPMDCTEYEVSTDLLPHPFTWGASAMSSLSINLSECQSLCSTRQECGSFRYSATDEEATSSCDLYPYSLDLLRLSNVSLQVALANSSSIGSNGNSTVAFYSKTCPITLSPCPSTFINSTLHIRPDDEDSPLLFQLDPIPQSLHILMEPSDCERFCSLFTSCLSYSYLLRPLPPGGPPPRLAASCLFYHSNLTHLARTYPRLLTNNLDVVGDNLLSVVTMERVEGACESGGVSTPSSTSPPPPTSSTPPGSGVGLHTPASTLYAILILMAFIHLG